MRRSTLRRVLLNGARYVREHGWRGYFEQMASSAVDRWYEWRLGIDTSGSTTAGPSPDRPDDVDYVPTPYALLRRALGKLPIHSDSCFLDYGAGRGRVLVTAATMPFRRVIGVEISSELVEDARRNLASAKRLACADITLVTRDAATFDVPDEVDVMHFFKPFRGKLLERVIDKIEESYRRAPRRITLIFFNDQEFREVVAHRRWLERTDGGVALGRTRWPITWGIYSTRSEGG